jgi:hypothetical protein
MMEGAEFPVHQHGFRNTGTTLLHIQGVLAAPHFEAWRGDDKEPSRHWSRADALVVETPKLKLQGSDIGS